MNYDIYMYETFDDNGVSIITLFVEIDGQIYRNTHRFVNERNKYRVIGDLFIEIGTMIKERKVDGK